MIKHVGKHNQRQIAIVYRKVPGDEHMALVIYPDTLPAMIHDETMKTLESAVGQQAKELADALYRTTMADGENCLSALHRKGYLKKVPTNQVIVTASKNSTCRLDQLNALIDKIDAGGEAAEELANIDQNRGIRGANPNIHEGREVGMPKSLDKPGADIAGDFNTAPVAAPAGVLSNADLASMNIEQAKQMQAQATTLLAEATRLITEATNLNPAPAKAPAKKAPAKAKATPKETTTAPAKAKNVRATKKATA